MPAPAKAGPADPACSARPPRRTSPTKSPPTAPVSWPSVPRDGTFRREQQTRSQAETDPGHHPQRPFPIDSSQPPAASSLGGFPTRAEVTPRRSRPPRPASKNLHQSCRSLQALWRVHPDNGFEQPTRIKIAARPLRMVKAVIQEENLALSHSPWSNHCYSSTLASNVISKRQTRKAPMPKNSTAQKPPPLIASNAPHARQVITSATRTHKGRYLGSSKLNTRPDLSN